MSSADTCAELLAGSDFFGGLFRTLNAEETRIAARIFNPVQFTGGQSIFARGDPGDFLLAIAEGQIRLSIVSDEGRELSVRHARRGQIIGEIALLDGRPRSADAMAVGMVKAFTLSRAGLKTLQARFPVLQSLLVEFLCHRLRETTDQLEAIALYPIEVRLARFLLLALKGRKPEPNRRVPLELGFSQSELAQLLGASRPKVNGALGQLEALGAIRRTSDRLFCDPALLAETARLADDA
jgi:CRP/FNR family transcriptional regulator, cyclic AMP receptor protein